MYTNSKRIKFRNGLLFDCFEIKYALLGCLSFTSETYELTQMLLYVLLCAAALDEKLSKKISIFKLIDGMIEIIGVDYANCKNYPAAKVLYCLDADTRMILFKYMISFKSDIGQDEYFDTAALPNTRLRIAQHKLKEKLDIEYGNVGNNPFFEPHAYLARLGEYLSGQLNEISMRIAKELYASKKTFLNRGER